jgi:uncharacterized protein YqjF (DUF2071 family)
MTRPRLNDFNHRILGVTEHRPWAMPASPWVMRQTWHDLLFAHWPVDASLLRPLVPRAFPLDTFEGQAWVGIVPFEMSNVAPRAVPALPWLSAFPELNVRTYVTLDGKPGVYFFSLDASNTVAVEAARLLAHLPYFTAAMEVDARNGWMDYRSRRTDRRGAPAALTARYRPTGDPHPPTPGTLEYFLTERYCLYTEDSRGRRIRLDIHHPPWPLQAAEAELTVNTMADAAGIRLPGLPPLVHYARRQDMVAWMPARL